MIHSAQTVQSMHVHEAFLGQTAHLGQERLTAYRSEIALADGTFPFHRHIEVQSDFPSRPSTDDEINPKPRYRLSVVWK